MCLEESNLEGYIVTSVENKQEIVCWSLDATKLTLITIKNCQMCKSLQSTVFPPPLSIQFANRSSRVVRSGAQIWWHSRAKKRAQKDWLVPNGMYRCCV
jgi:hypothetical protein